MSPMSKVHFGSRILSSFVSVWSGDSESPSSHQSALSDDLGTLFGAGNKGEKSLLCPLLLSPRFSYLHLFMAWYLPVVFQTLLKESLLYPSPITPFFALWSHLTVLGGSLRAHCSISFSKWLTKSCCPSKWGLTCVPWVSVVTHLCRKPIQLEEPYWEAASRASLWYSGRQKSGICILSYKKALQFDHQPLASLEFSNSYNPSKLHCDTSQLKGMWVVVDCSAARCSSTQRPGRAVSFITLQVTGRPNK